MTVEETPAPETPVVEEPPAEGEPIEATPEDIGKAIAEASVASVREILSSAALPAKEVIEPVTTQQTPTTAAAPSDLQAQIDKAIADSKAKDAHEAEHQALKSGDKPEVVTPPVEIPPKEKMNWFQKAILSPMGGKKK